MTSSDMERQDEIDRLSAVVRAHSFFSPIVTCYFAVHLMLLSEVLPGPLMSPTLLIAGALVFFSAMIRWMYVTLRYGGSACPECRQRYFYRRDNEQIFYAYKCNKCGSILEAPSWASAPGNTSSLQSILPRAGVFRAIALLAMLLPVVVLSAYGLVTGSEKGIESGDPGWVPSRILIWVCFGVALAAMQIGGRFACRHCQHQHFDVVRFGNTTLWVKCADFLMRNRCPTCGSYRG